MNRLIYILPVFFFLGRSLMAGTVTFSNLSGNYFDFKTMSETGDNVPPSNLENPTLITNPKDGITFHPSAFVVVESQLGTLDTKTLSSQLEFILAAKPSFTLGDLTINVAGTFSKKTYSIGGNIPTATNSLSLNPINFTIGGVTKILSPALQVVGDVDTGTWSGSVSLSAADFRTLFSSPTMQISEMRINSTATVSATAQYATATSYLTDMSFVVTAIPEPTSFALLCISSLVPFLLRKKLNLKRK